MTFSNPFTGSSAPFRCLILAAVACSAAAASGTLPPHPRLLLDAEGVVQLRQRIEKAPWAAAEWKELAASAERRLGKPVALPPRGGNWSHNYVCPEHSARLKQGKRIGPWEWEHHCPEGPHVLRGDPSKATLDFDGNGIAGAHADLAAQAVEHGLVYQVSGDKRHARKAAEILLAYASRYRDYPMHDNQGRMGKGARVASQSLTEGSWLIHIAQGADLVWPALSDAERRTIEQGLLRAALKDVILPAKMGIHNIKCRLNSAIGLVGLLLGDRGLIDLAIDEPSVGQRQQIAKGVLDDGMWTEGSSGYHFFTIEGLWPLAEAARHCGIDLYSGKFQKMFDAPLTFARPDAVLPDFNDSGSVSLSGHAPLYELAYARFRQPAYLSLLSTSDRRNRMALLYGEITLPSGAGSELGSRNSPASGYAILQQGAGREATWLCLKYGPHGGGHGHFDKNHFILYHRGEMLVPDSGTHAYGSPLHKDWDKESFAHNTLVVDQTRQAQAQGRCIDFGRAGGVDFAMTDAGPIYPNVRHVRSVAMVTPTLVLVVDQVRAGRVRTLDIVHHQLGAWGAIPEGRPWTPPDVAGYRYVTGGTVRPTGEGQLVFALKQGAGKQAVLVAGAGGEPGELIAGQGVLKTTKDRVPLLIQRRRGTEAAFVWALSLDGVPATLRAEPVSGTDGRELPRSTALRVSVDQGGLHREFIVNPERAALGGGAGNASAGPVAFAVR